MHGQATAVRAVADSSGVALGRLAGGLHPCVHDTPRNLKHVPWHKVNGHWFPGPYPCLMHFRSCGAHAECRRLWARRASKFPGMALRKGPSMMCRHCRLCAHDVTRWHCTCRCPVICLHVNHPLNGERTGVIEWTVTLNLPRL